MLWRFTYAAVCTRSVLFLFHWLILFQVPCSPWSLGEMSNPYPALSVFNPPPNPDQGSTRPRYLRKTLFAQFSPPFCIHALWYILWGAPNESREHVLLFTFTSDRWFSLSKRMRWMWPSPTSEPELLKVLRFHLLLWFCHPRGRYLPKPPSGLRQRKRDAGSSTASLKAKHEEPPAAVWATVSKCGLLHRCGWLMHPLPLHHRDLLGKKETAASHMAKGTPEPFHFFFKAQLRVLPVP